MLANSQRSANDSEKEERIWRTLQREVERLGRGRFRLPDELRQKYQGDLDDIKDGGSTAAATAGEIAASLADHACCYPEVTVVVRADPTPRAGNGEAQAITENAVDKRTPDAEFGSAPLAYARAQHVGRRADVRRFRRDVLAGQLLTLADITGWLDRQLAEDGPQTIWDVAAVPRIRENLHLYDEVPAKGHLRGFRRLIACDERSGVGIQVGSEMRHLWIAVSNGTVRCVQTAQGGVLETLRALAYTIAEDVGWFEAEAAAFILTGEPASVPLIRETLVLRSSSSGRGRDHIILDIDPQVSPRAVAQQLAALRRTLLKRPRRSKHDVDAKYAAVLEFWQTYGDCDQHERVRHWNANYPAWRINSMQPNALRQLYVRAYRWQYGQNAPTPSPRKHPGARERAMPIDADVDANPQRVHEITRDDESRDVLQIQA